MNELDNQPILRYNKISDLVTYLSGNLMIRMNVILFSNSERYGRKYYYSEFGYNDKNGFPSVKISRTFDAYLSIETYGKSYYVSKRFLILRMGELEKLKCEILPKLKDWLISRDKIIEVRSDNNLYMRNSYGSLGRKEWKQYISPIIFNTNNLLFSFKPGINSERGEMCIVLMCENPHEEYKINILKIYEFIRIIEQFDISLYASSMINYLGRPEIGTNYNHINNPIQGGRSNNPFEQKGVTNLRTNIQGEKQQKEIGYFANLLN